jgi:hypothetical protein
MTQLISRPEPAEMSTVPPGSPIHILYLIDVLWGLGGAEGVLLRIPRLLPKDRYRCTIGTFRLRPDLRSSMIYPAPYGSFRFRGSSAWARSERRSI